jgi:ATP-dependent DNA ligase
MNAWRRRRVLLIRLLAKAPVVGLQVNDHIVEPGDVVFRHACQLGFEGIVSKRLGSPYVSGRSRHWVENKNPQHPAVKREAEGLGQRTMAMIDAGRQVLILKRASASRPFQSME